MNIKNNCLIKTSPIKTSCTYLLPFFLFLCLPINLMALANDSEQALNLEADNADIDDLKGISVYTGNVILTQGSMVIKSAKLTIHLDKNRDLEKAIASGSKNKLAKFKQRPEGKKTDFFARAETMIYYLQKDKIHLLKQAYINQNGDTFSGDKIIYDTKKETVAANTSKKSSNSRVRVTIQPKRKK